MSKTQVPDISREELKKMHEVIAEYHTRLEEARENIRTAPALSILTKRAYKRLVTSMSGTRLSLELLLGMQDFQEGRVRTRPAEDEYYFGDDASELLYRAFIITHDPKESLDEQIEELLSHWNENWSDYKFGQLKERLSRSAVSLLRFHENVVANGGTLPYTRQQRLIRFYNSLIGLYGVDNALRVLARWGLIDPDLL